MDHPIEGKNERIGLGFDDGRKRHPFSPVGNLPHGWRWWWLLTDFRSGRLLRLFNRGKPPYEVTKPFASFFRCFTPMFDRSPLAKLPWLLMRASRLVAVRTRSSELDGFFFTTYLIYSVDTADMWQYDTYSPPFSSPKIKIKNNSDSISSFLKSYSNEQAVSWISCDV